MMMKNILDTLKKQCRPAQLMTLVAVLASLQIVLKQMDKPEKMVKDLFMQISPLVVLVLFTQFLCTKKRPVLAYGVVVGYFLYSFLLCVKEEAPKEKKEEKSESDMYKDFRTPARKVDEYLEDMHDEMAYDPSASTEGSAL